MTTKELAAVCGVSEQAIRAWCRRNQVAKDAKGSFAISESVKMRIYQHYHVSERNDVAQHEKASCATDESKLRSEQAAETVPLSVYEDLKAQLAIKDKQIADLSAALLAAQETAKAAQTLHGMEKHEDLLLESVEQKKERKSRWAFWRR